ncbi:hypothetical protein N8831_02660 [Flavobacteriaceae bacterium]|nr:hypothetical protein [Flavobacteriaceae bacterium]
MHVTSSDCTERAIVSRSMSLRVFSEGKCIEKYREATYNQFFNIDQVLCCYVEFLEF